MLGGGEAEDEEANPALGYSLEDDGSRAWDDSRPSRELVEAFGEWHWEQNCFHDHVVAFALAHRQALLDTPAGEHSHAVHELHKQFSSSLESFVAEFLASHGVSEQAFAAALEEQKREGDITARMTVDVVTDEVLSLLEYPSFHRSMIEALALEASAPGDSLVREDADRRTAEARELLESLALRDEPAAAEERAAAHQRDVDAGGAE